MQVVENGKVGIFHSIDANKYCIILSIMYSDEKDDWDVLNEAPDYIDRVKPILRRLEDMTDENNKYKRSKGVDSVSQRRGD